MPSRPRERESCRAPSRMPRPLSSTVRSSALGVMPSRTSTRVAAAWRATLVSASWKMRNTAVARLGSTAGCPSGSSTRHSMPVRVANSRASHSIAAQAKLVQDAGTQLGGDSLDPLGGAVDDRRHAVELACQLGGGLEDTLLEPEHVDLQGGERLAELVGDFAGDAGALRFAGRLEPRRQPAQLSAVTLQLRLRRFTLRDVFDHADEPLRRAGFRGERRHGDVGPDQPAVLAAVALLERVG